MTNRLQKVRAVQDVCIGALLNHVFPKRQVLTRKMFERFAFEQIIVAVLHPRGIKLIKLEAFLARVSSD